ncbi:hypothetical protein LNP00_02180 [Fructobacillus sp. M158]|uniref:hypothetical protein n=1 Tax=Fructobacillus parabroussonetiae TaxID=2713174 RepID=UPI00200B3093|nr:hypothetical protein [Fructobacillus parabroussonetiae]MCK8617177.1 hypothetical protein [Fructobacillus parabroussonetiae]
MAAGKNAALTQTILAATAVENALTLSERKKLAKQAVDEVVKQEQRAVHESDLMTNSKAAQNAALDLLGQAAKAAIEQAEDATKVDELAQSGQQDLVALTVAKKNSYATLRQVAAKDLQQVAGDANRLASEKQEEVTAIQAALQKVFALIDRQKEQSAVKELDVLSVYADQLANRTIHAGVEKLSNRKEAAEQTVAALTKKAEATINQDASLADAEKVDQKNAFEEAAKAAEKRIAQAGDADQVHQVEEEAQTTLSSLHQAMAASRAYLQEKTTSAAEKVENNQNLSASEKAERQEAIQTLLHNAFRHVDDQRTVEAAKAAIDDFDFDQALAEIVSDRQVTSLEDRKQLAMTAMTNSASWTKLVIEQKMGLSAVSKVERQSRIDDELVQVQEKINAETDVDTVNQLSRQFEKTLAALAKQKPARKTAPLTAAVNQESENDHQTSPEADLTASNQLGKSLTDQDKKEKRTWFRFPFLTGNRFFASAKKKQDSAK